MAEGEKGKQRQEQAAGTRRRLLDSAKQLFYEKGYSATSVRSINRAIGMADGILYHYFPGGKKEILQTMVREEFLEVAGELASRQQGFSDLPLEEIIEQIYSSGAEIMEKHDVLIAIIFKERSVIDLLEWEQFAAILKEQRRWFPALLKERAARGEIREIDYESAAATLSALLMDHFLVKLTGMGTGCLGDETFRKRLIRFHIGLWKGSAPEPPVL